MESGLRWECPVKAHLPFHRNSPEASKSFIKRLDAASGRSVPAPHPVAASKTNQNFTEAFENLH
jgi:hypothetical protein